MTTKKLRLSILKIHGANLREDQTVEIFYDGKTGEVTNDLGELMFVCPGISPDRYDAYKHLCYRMNSLHGDNWSVVEAFDA